MRERRATVRIRCLLPIQYTLPGGLLPYGGRISNLSVRGACLLGRTGIGRGEPLKMSVMLPSEEQLLTVNGIVRWTGSGLFRDGERPCGIEFTDLDDTRRFCLQAFVTDQLQHQKPSGPFGRTASRLLEHYLSTRSLQAGLLAAGGLLIVGLCAWIMVLNQQTMRLGQDLAERAIVVNQLEARHTKLQEELTQAHGLMTQTRVEIERLQQQRAQLEGHVQGLAVALEEVTQAYVRVRDEREVLQQRVSELEQREAQLLHRLTSIRQLSQAIRQARLARRHRVQEARRQRIVRLRETDQQELQSGNGGYIIRAGVPTISSTLRIRVLPPESTH